MRGVREEAEHASFGPTDGQASTRALLRIHGRPMAPLPTWLSRPERSKDRVCQPPRGRRADRAPAPLRSPASTSRKCSDAWSMGQTGQGAPASRSTPGPFSVSRRAPHLRPRRIVQPAVQARQRATFLDCESQVACIVGRETMAAHQRQDAMVFRFARTTDGQLADPGDGSVGVVLVDSPAALGRKQHVLQLGPE